MTFRLLGLVFLQQCCSAVLIHSIWVILLHDGYMMVYVFIIHLQVFQMPAMHRYSHLVAAFANLIVVHSRGLKASMRHFTIA